MRHKRLQTLGCKSGGESKYRQTYFAGIYENGLYELNESKLVY